jgi:two-component system LytT family response regulator
MEPQAMSTAERADRPVQRLAVRERGRVRFLPVDQIEWIDAWGDDCRVHTLAGAVETVRRSITDLEGALGPRDFARIHRSTIVAVAQIAELRMSTWGDYVAFLHSGQRLNVGRSYRGQLRLLG